MCKIGFSGVEFPGIRMDHEGDHIMDFNQSTIDWWVSEK